MKEKKNAVRAKKADKIVLLLAVVLVLLSAVFEKTGLWDRAFRLAGLSPRAPYGGEADCAGKVIRYIRKLGFDTIDCYIGTHPHSDHIGVAAEIIGAFGVKNVIIPRTDESAVPDSSGYSEMISAVASSGAKVYAAIPGDSYSFGEIALTVLGPYGKSGDLNDMSAVFRVQYGEKTFLFMGDAGREEENDMLSSGAGISCDVLKVGHHGSSSSSSEEFIRAVSPSYAVISCGRNNVYGHPDKSVKELLSSFGTEIFVTSEKGTVVFATDGKTLDISTIK